MTQTAAGKLLKRVMIQSRSTALGTRGQSTEAWTDVAVGGNRWGSITHLSGRELEQARKIVATATTEITLRNPRSFDLTTQHRIVYRDENYNIGSIVPQGDDHQDVVLLCERVL